MLEGAVCMRMFVCIIKMADCGYSDDIQLKTTNNITWNSQVTSTPRGDDETVNDVQYILKTHGIRMQSLSLIAGLSHHYIIRPSPGTDFCQKKNSSWDQLVVCDVINVYCSVRLLKTHSVNLALVRRTHFASFFLDSIHVYLCPT